MGCDFYNVAYGLRSGGWGKVLLTFSEDDDSVACLCTFPRNYEDRGLTALDVRSLAYLGAAVALAHNGSLTPSWEEGNHGLAYIPESLPRWVVEAIDRHLPRA